MDVTRELAEYVAELGRGPLPEPVVDQTKRCLLDLLGIAARGQIEAESSPALAAAVEELAPGGGPSTAVGHGRGYAPQYAAFLNGSYGHSLDFDDTHAGSSLHPGAPVIPAALALGEVRGSSGEDVLRAIVAGYEVIVRTAEALPAAVHYARGFHPTATAGAFGAATAGVLLDGGNAAAQANAWGIALSFTAGTLQFVENGSWNKRFQVGWAAHNGVVAATLQRRGVLGAAAAIDGKFGFLNSYSDGARPELALAGRGERWIVLETALKPYPCCRYTHSAIDGLIALASELDLAPADIASVEIGMSAPGIRLTAVPEARKQDPRNIVDGQFSMAWTAAMAIMRRRVGWSDYDDLRHPDVLALARRVTVRLDPEVDGNLPANWSARLHVHLTDGRTIDRFILRPKGEPELPLAWSDVEAKFHTLAETAFGEEQRRAIIDRVRRLDQLGSISELTATLRPLVPAR